MRSTESAVKRLAVSRGLELLQPETLRDEPLLRRLREVRADAMVVAAYGQLLPPPALEAARHGALNIHASLLPRWRGAAPIQRALLAGDRETGICIMRMDAGLDTGPVYTRRAISIGDQDDAGTLHDRLAAHVDGNSRADIPPLREEGVECVGYSFVPHGDTATNDIVHDEILSPPNVPV